MTLHSLELTPSLVHCTKRAVLSVKRNVNFHKFKDSDSFNKPLCHFILEHPTPRDCYDIRAQNPNATSGVYTVYPGAIRRGLDVLCDMDVDEGGWLVSKLVCIFILTCTVLVKKKYAIQYYRFTDLILNFSEAMYACKAIFCSVRRF